MKWQEFGSYRSSEVAGGKECRWSKLATIDRAEIRNPIL